MRLCGLVKLLLEEREISPGVLSWDLVGMGSAFIVLRAQLSATAASLAVNNSGWLSETSLGGEFRSMLQMCWCLALLV